jgi:hypothetical protein
MTTHIFPRHNRVVVHSNREDGHLGIKIVNADTLPPNTESVHVYRGVSFYFVLNPADKTTGLYQIPGGESFDTLTETFAHVDKIRNNQNQ